MKMHVHEDYMKKFHFVAFLCLYDFLFYNLHATPTHVI